MIWNFEQVLKISRFSSAPYKFRKGIILLLTRLIKPLNSYHNGYTAGFVSSTLIVPHPSKVVCFFNISTNSVKVSWNPLNYFLDREGVRLLLKMAYMRTRHFQLIPIAFAMLNYFFITLHPPNLCSFNSDVIRLGVFISLLVTRNRVIIVSKSMFISPPRLLYTGVWNDVNQNIFDQLYAASSLQVSFTALIVNDQILINTS